MVLPKNRPADRPTKKRLADMKLDMEVDKVTDTILSKKCSRFLASLWSDALGVTAV